MQNMEFSLFFSIVHCFEFCYQNNSFENKKNIFLSFFILFEIEIYKNMFRLAAHFLNEYKIVRGMLSYAVLWPMGSLIEQTLVEKRNWHTYDWTKCLR